MGGCNIRFKNSFLSLQPSFMVMSDFKSWREDVQCRLAYEYESRSFYVGDEIQEEDIKAKFENGTLQISVPKKIEQPKLEEKRTISID